MSTRTVLASLALLLPSTGMAVDPVKFSREVLPVLSDKCFYCHGPDPKHREAELRLDVEDAAKAPREHGPAIVPGIASESLLVRRIFAADPDDIMPPLDAHKNLTPSQKDTLRRWIDEGAPWGKHWAFSPLERPPVPPGELDQNPIDALVGARLVREGLAISPEADPRTLLRRLSLDLTGLPPTPDEMTAWLADTSPDAWKRQVDRVLASPAYGERMAWDWMEAARYADTNGYQGDNERTMWPWRDWVVRAFNANMPWNRFTVWQLAGDLLPDATDEQRLATGFLRNHPINGEGGRIPEENRVDYVMDMAETTGTVWLGLTMNCCRCHDHKFDPLTQRDYYSLFGFFNQTPVDGGGGDPQTPPVLSVPAPVARARQVDVKAALEEKAAALESERAAAGSRRGEWERMILDEASDRPTWIALRPTAAVAEQSDLTVQEDFALLNSGANPVNDHYRITAKPGAGRWSGLRLDALRHPTMAGGGLARSDSGNFVLTTLRVERRQTGGDMEIVPLSVGEATFEQGEYKLAGVLDDNPKTGWAVHEGRVVDRNHAAVLRFTPPLETDPDTELTIHLWHESPHARHNLGHFRLSVTETAAPGLTDTNAALLDALRKPETKRDDTERAALTAAWEEADATLAALHQEIAALEKERDALAKAMPKVMVMAERDKPRATHVLDHGLYNKELAEVPSATPGYLPAMPDDQPRNRLGLARWVVSDENPLTSRVTVNRFWQMLFGTGLVKTAEDFGVQSEFPVQAELLDWLAAEFRDSGWDVKRLLRLILTSRTWKQSSRASPELLEHDPFNRLLARGARFRMPSWMIRDQALAASGLLRPMDGGPPVKPWQPDGVWEEATFGNVKYARSSGDDLHRRSLYTFWRRIVGPTMFFDTGSRLVCTVKPVRTNTPLHALATTNDVTYVEAARALAQMSADLSDPAARVDALFLRVLGRPARAEEAAVLLTGLERALAKFSADPEKTRALLEEGAAPPAPEARTPELAAWTMTALTLLNLDETLNRE